MSRLLGRITSLALCAALALAPVAHANPIHEGFRRFFSPDNPLPTSLGTLIPVASVPFLTEGAKRFIGAGAGGVVGGFAGALLGQALFGEKPDWAKAAVSGLGATAAVLPFALMTGPLAPLVLFGTSMAGSMIATWLLDTWRERQKQPPADERRRAEGGPRGGTAPAGGMSLLGVGSR